MILSLAISLKVMCREQSFSTKNELIKTLAPLTRGGFAC